MKTKYWILLIGLVLILCFGISFFLLPDSTPATRAEIRSDGKVLKVVDLTVDQEFTIPSPDGGTNTVTVKDGKIAVTFADCPDQYCVKQGFCNSGNQIVCLPHRLVISFLGEGEIDGVVG